MVFIEADDQIGLTAVDVKSKGLTLHSKTSVGLGGKVHSAIDGCDGLW
jgi:predicted NUDIX family phosphoesterase